jgi:hypothetical protein
MTRGLLGVVTVDGIKRRYYAAMKSAAHGPLPETQTNRLLADLSRLLEAYADIADRIYAVDRALDGYHPDRKDQR